MKARPCAPESRRGEQDPECQMKQSRPHCFHLSLLVLLESQNSVAFVFAPQPLSVSQFDFPSPELGIFRSYQFFDAFVDFESEGTGLKNQALKSGPI